MHNIAIILSGGSGRRMGGTLPKQFIEVEGRTILEMSIEAFHRHQDIQGVMVVSNADYLDRVEALVEKNAERWPKMIGITVGGKERSDSSRNALAFLEQRGLVTPETCVLIHDAVRPLVSERIMPDATGIWCRRCRYSRHRHDDYDDTRRKTHRRHARPQHTHACADTTGIPFRRHQGSLPPCSRRCDLSSYRRLRCGVPLYARRTHGPRSRRCR